MSMLRAMSMRLHNYCRTGDYVFIGSVKTAEEAIQLRDIEENYMMKRMYRGLLVDTFLAHYSPTTTHYNPTTTAIGNVYMQDCTFVRYPSLGHRCKYFAPKKCSYKKRIVKLPSYMIITPESLIKQN